MAQKSGPAAKRYDPASDDREGVRENVDFPDFNTPLNVMKAAAEPGPDVLDLIDPWDTGGEPPDPNNFVAHLEMGKKGKKR
jgi:hypothetical protein